MINIQMFTISPIILAALILSVNSLHLNNHAQGTELSPDLPILVEPRPEFTSPKQTDLQAKLQSLFPDMITSRKGDNGRVGVIGGSFEYTGAPYYAAMSALRSGADLAFVFCAKSAANAIKAYSPQLIVHPVFVSSEQQSFTPEELKAEQQVWLNKIMRWKRSIKSWIIGPGLGRDPYLKDFFPLLIKSIPDRAVVVLDADALSLLCQHPQLTKQFGRLKVILSPNYRQLSKLEQCGILQVPYQKIRAKNQNPLQKQQLPGTGLNFTVVAKGNQTLILGGNKSFIVRLRGSPKRAGGLGDLLTGALSVYANWDFDYGPALACTVIREASKRGYFSYGRSMTAPDVLAEFPETVRDIDPQGSLTWWR